MAPRAAPAQAFAALSHRLIIGFFLVQAFAIACPFGNAAERRTAGFVPAMPFPVVGQPPAGYPATDGREYRHPPRRGGAARRPPARLSGPGRRRPAAARP